VLKNLVRLVVFFAAFSFLAACGEGSKNISAGDNSNAENNDEDTAAPDLAGDENDEDNGVENDDPEPVADDDDTVSIPDEDQEPVEEPQVISLSPSAFYEDSSVGIIITTDELEEVFKKFAVFHTVTGIPTKVVTVSSVCDAYGCDDSDPATDTSSAIKKYLMSVEGLRYVVLGGDSAEVPSRKVHDHYKNLLAGEYEEDFYSDLFFADFSDWDANGNGEYAEDDDSPKLVADVAIGRISVSTVEDAELYFQKLLKHSTAYDVSRIKSATLLANIAATVSGIDVNSGYYFMAEGKTESIIASDYDMKKYYTKTIPFPDNTAEYLTNESEKAAIEAGPNLIVHSGHGAPWLLSCEQETDDNDFTGDMAFGLENTNYPIFLSCACEAGQFTYRSDSAGEKLMKAPNGGAILYLGNTTTGLGIAGGSQFIDEMLKNMFAYPSAIIGESYLYAHLSLPKYDTFNPPISFININAPVVDTDSWKWTKKSVVMLGDPMLTFWRDEHQPFGTELVPAVEKSEEGMSVIFEIPEEFSGLDLTLFANDKIYNVPFVLAGTLELVFAEPVSELYIGIRADGRQYFFQKFEFE